MNAQALADRAKALADKPVPTGQQTFEFVADARAVLYKCATALADAAEYEALFDLQWTRMQEATERWRAEAPEERALTLPDLGKLLTWLLQRGDAAALAQFDHRTLLRTAGELVDGTAVFNEDTGCIDGVDATRWNALCDAVVAHEVVDEQITVGDAARLDGQIPVAPKGRTDWAAEGFEHIRFVDGACTAQFDLADLADNEYVTLNREAGGWDIWRKAGSPS